MLPETLDDITPDRCPVCWTPITGGARWTLRSRHLTSEGEIEYCRSACGCTAVMLDGELVKTVPVRTR